ncbi:hypothetical protein Goklo_007692 [Gossypium klotzschianum]|uniref:Uncharacterized protein n=1 Tax=Gossypium klotzschianum TaxID=34286 RepID=A0A7J8UXN6_9ROSI|nr:hypothetical protein [Gossypium klotzschianum]
MENIEDDLPQKRAKLENFDWKDIYNMDETNLFYQIGDVEGIHKLKEVISDLHYRNAMDVMQILNYPSENKSLIEPPTDEEIIQRAMDVSADDELWIP